MKKFFLKSTLILLGTIFVPSLVNAQQIDLNTPADGFLNELKAVLPKILGIAYIVFIVFLVFKHYTDGNSDLKKSILNAVGGAVIISLIYGLIRFVLSLAL